MVCLAYSAMNTKKIRIISITDILIPNGYAAEISDECLFLYIQKGYIRSSEYMYMYIGGGSVSGKLMILVPPNLHPIILFEPIPVYGCISNRHVRCFFSVWWAGQQTGRLTLKALLFI